MSTPTGIIFEGLIVHYTLKGKPGTGVIKHIGKPGLRGIRVEILPDGNNRRTIKIPLGAVRGFGIA